MTHKLPEKIVLVLSCAVCLLLFVSAFGFRSHQSIEWDEGVYLTTFKSVQHGFPLYAQTYLSQPPGFFIAIFPLYAVFGSTLESGRLAIFFYSLVGLLGIVWLGWELDSVVFSFIAISVLYFIPIYITQILTFHDDSLPSAFSVLALASIFRFRNTAHWRWIFLSSVFVTIAILIKADVSVLPSVFFVLAFTALAKRKNVLDFIKASAILGFTALLVLFAFTVPFGLSNVFADVVQLRLQAANASSADPALLVNYLQGQSQMVVLSALAMVLSAIVIWKKKEKRLPVLMIGLWLLSTLALLLIYHPLMGHHLVLLALPVSLFFSFALFSVFSLFSVSTVFKGYTLLGVNAGFDVSTPPFNVISKASLPRFIAIGAVLVTIILLVDRVNSPLAPQGPILTDSETIALNLVTTYTQPQDYIVSDDGLLIGLSDRYTPPALTDTSHVRIDSRNLTPDDFENSLLQYKPKLVLTWTERLVHLGNFDVILQRHNYRLAADLGSFRKAYLLQP